MKSIMIIAIAIGLIAIVAIIGGNYFVQNQTAEMYEIKPWLGLNCDKMLDFSASKQHQDMTMDQHMEFHQYYYDHCSETELGKP